MEAPSVAAARPAWKDIGYGSIAGMISKVFETCELELQEGHDELCYGPLTTLSISSVRAQELDAMRYAYVLAEVRLQSQPLDRPARFSGPIDCFRQTFTNEGTKGLYRGLSMPVMGAMAENASLFVVYSQTQALLRRYFPVTDSDGRAPLPLSQLAFAGGCAGAVTSFVLTPIELVKVRMQVQMIAQEQNLVSASISASGHPPATSARPPLPGPVQLLNSVLRQHGWKGLWLGQTGTFIREAGGSVAWFSAFEGVARAFIAQRQNTAPNRQITKDDLSSAELMLAGACAGAGYTVVLFPADCIKSTIQTGEELGRSKTNTGFLAVGREIYQARGIKGLYSGCGVTIVRSAPSSALIFWIYSLLERHFG